MVSSEFDPEKPNVNQSGSRSLAGSDQAFSKVITLDVGESAVACDCSEQTGCSVPRRKSRRPLKVIAAGMHAGHFEATSMVQSLPSPLGSPLSPVMAAGINPHRYARDAWWDR